MARAYVAVGGSWKAVASPYVAVGGEWKSVPYVGAASGGRWLSSHSGAPKVVQFSVTRSTTAPWTRASVNWTVSGMWGSVVTLVGPVKGIQKIVHESGPSVSEKTESLYNHPLTGLSPGAEYEATLSYRDALGKPSVLAKARFTMSDIPMIPAMGPKGPFSHQAGGVFWEPIPDAQGYLCRNDNLGTQWETGPTGTYIYYSSGLSPSTAYHFRAAVKMDGRFGPWTPQHIVSTHAAPYAKGTFRLHPHGSETYQSGGSQGAKWQGGSRSLFYAGNGSTWGSTRGTQRTCFFYGGDDGWNKVVDAVNKGGTIAGARLYVHREGAEGYNSGVPAVVTLHTTSKPNAPSAYTGNIVVGSFARNTAGWVAIPADWVWHIATGRCSGVMMGLSSSASHYMSMNKGSGLLDVDIS